MGGDGNVNDYLQKAFEGSGLRKSSMRKSSRHIFLTTANFILRCNNFCPRKILLKAKKNLQRN